jgi:hypothetical protein
MQPDMGAYEEIERYLARICSSADGVPLTKLHDWLRELRSHIVEHARMSGGVSRVSVLEALTALGSPRDLALEFRRSIDENASIESPEAQEAQSLLMQQPSLALPLLGLIAVAIALCLAISSSFILCAVLKPFDPRGVGLWVGPASISLLVGAPPQPSDVHEILGWWMIPVGLSIATLGFYVMLRLAQWSTPCLHCLKRSLRQLLVAPPWH